MESRALRLSALLLLSTTMAASARAQLADPSAPALLPTATDSGAPTAPGVCRVVVLNLQGKNLPDADKDVPALLTETLANEVNLVSGCQVITQADVAQMLDFEATKAACTDGADSCLSEIGSALGAEHVVGGSLGKLGGDFVLNVRLMNVNKATVEARAEQVVPGAVEKLRLASKNAARELYGKPPVVDVGPLPPVTPVAPAPPPSTFPSPLFLVGAGVAGVGVVGAGVGGTLLGLAEARLSDPQETAKDAALDQGAVALVIAGVGGGAVVTGVGLIIASLVVE